MDMCFQAIGVMHSSFTDPVGMPIQPMGASGTTAELEVFPDFETGLSDVEGFSHLILIYYLHRVTTTKLTVTPFLDTVPHGVFATRAPTRPNPIGLSTVRLLNRHGRYLQLENVDILDGTPVLDIKPCVPEFDHCAVDRIGWLETVRGQISDRRSDDRFQRSDDPSAE
jgi:tRNA (adenine37-N6)-methyltransferase